MRVSCGPTAVAVNLRSPGRGEFRASYGSAANGSATTTRKDNEEPITRRNHYGPRPVLHKLRL